MSDDLWALREILRECAHKKISAEKRETLSKIEEHVNQARHGASPKTQAGLDLMSRAITDIRTICVEEPAKKKRASTKPAGKS